jgi:hypothetical protein
MKLKQLTDIFTAHKCPKIYIKTLSPNDNSKNQVYLGGSFDILNILPFKNITADDSGDWKKARFKAELEFAWIGENTSVYPAPKSQLILYPKYPEVRFSGFLARCENPPSSLMTQRTAGRLLLLGITPEGRTLGYVTSPDTSIANALNKQIHLEDHGVFKILHIDSFSQESVSKELLLKELKRINKLGWIESKRLNKSGEIISCNAPQCGGYTLEAELGIIPNGFSEPDFLGWEVKQFGVKKFELFNSSVITLMTPEPNGGIYNENGVGEFIQRYGYNDKRGREDRLNFGGIFKAGIRHAGTKIYIKLEWI